MKKIALLAFVLVLLSTAIVVRFVSPVVSYSAKTELLMEVDPPVHNIDSGKNFSTIQEAINDNETLDGHTILIDAETYYENVVVNKTVSLVGENPTTTIIDGEGLGNVVKIIINNVAIQNFTMRNSAQTWCGGIYIENCNYTIIQNNIIMNNRFGIYLENSSNNVISGNYLTNNDEGIFLLNSAENTISGNNLTNNRYDGIDFRFSSNNVISENNIADNTYGIYLSDYSNNNIISVNHITNHSHGVFICVFSSNNTIFGNNIRNNEDSGISLYDSNNNTISGNNITQSLYGIHVGGSSNIISGNILSDNKYNFKVIGDLWSDWTSHLATHSIDTTNLVNGKPVYYIVNQKDSVISPTTHPQVGYLALINCINITVENLTLASNGEGLLLSNTNCSKITNNNVTNNKYGIVLVNSSNNVVPGNNLINNMYGLSILYSGENNVVYHNNFVNNTLQVYTFWLDSVNVWDDGYPSGGNYWSDYTGVDANMDGIRDSSYEIDSNNIDHYPLMGTFSDFPATLEEQTYHVTTVCNSTISAFEFDQVNRIIRFNVTGEVGIGFCRVCIPYDLMEPPYTVTVDGLAPQYVNYTLHDNGTHTWIYFTYLHSEHEVEIIPEFPTWTSTLLILIVLTFAIAIYKRRILKTSIH